MQCLHHTNCKHSQQYSVKYTYQRTWQEASVTKQKFRNEFKGTSQEKSLQHHGR